LKKFNRVIVLAASMTLVSWALPACREAPPENHEEIVRSGLSEILSHQEAGCEKVISWKIDQRFDYHVTCGNGMTFRIHVGTEGHVNVAEHPKQ
jgi:hypothetical protein